jgi:hypothetical protein
MLNQRSIAAAGPNPRRNAGIEATPLAPPARAITVAT